MTDGDDTLRMLADAARGFGDFDAKRLRAMREEPPGYDRTRWRAMAEQGWLSILIDEADGGLGLGIDAATTIAEELGRASTVEPFVAAGVMVPALLSGLGARRIGDDNLAALLAGEAIAAIAWQSTTGSIEPTDTAVMAKGANGGYLLTGESRFVPVADADAYFVVGKSGDDLAIFYVPADTEGLVRQPEPTADGGYLAWLSFNGVHLPPSACLADGRNAADALTRALDLGVLANCAELLGIMDRALEMTLEYLKVRRQFGQAIGSFQVLQPRAVDLWMKKQVPRHALDAAIRTATSPDVPARARTIAASSAKARAAEVAHLMINECIQLHGAIGYTDEHDLSLYANRVLAIAPFLGNAAEHLRRYGNLKDQSGVSA